jgi:sulfate transport system ATP-binding protein
MSIEIQQINKAFGPFQALNQVSLSVNTGELLALIGPSGCGKTTLLRIIAGLEVPDSGRIVLAGEDATAQHVRERQVGFVFQHYALFRHMSVFENVAFGLRVKPRHERLSAAAIRTKVMDLLKLVQLDWLADRYPSQLSGGQRQRIALARALAVEPKVLLLDEPFGALDTKVRKDLRRWLRRLHDEVHITSVFVTHDQEEALEVADRVVVMNKGHLEQVGTPDEVYSAPATPFVYQFLGNVNLFHSRTHAAWTSTHGDAVAYVRPHDIEIYHERTDQTDLAATVNEVRAIGPIVRLELTHGSEPDRIEVELTRERYDVRRFAPGDRVFIRPRSLRVFP